MQECLVQEKTRGSLQLYTLLQWEVPTSDSPLFDPESADLKFFRLLEYDFENK